LLALTGFYEIKKDTTHLIVVIIKSLNFINYYLLALLLLTVLMVIKRMHSLFRHEIEELEREGFDDSNKSKLEDRFKICYKIPSLTYG
jgi:hypothetical protein